MALGIGITMLWGECVFISYWRVEEGGLKLTVTPLRTISYGWRQVRLWQHERGREDVADRREGQLCK